MRRSRRPTPTLPAGLLLAGLVFLGAVPASAHEEAVLRSSRSAVTAGDTLELTGEDFGPGEVYELELRGPLRSYELPGIEPDSTGRIAARRALPRDTRPGRYRLVAVAPDGDQVASLQLTVEARSEGEAAAGTAGGAEEPDPADRARAGEMPVERTRSGLEWFLVGLFVVGAGGGGLALLRDGTR